MSFFKRVWSGTKKVARTAVIGAGTVLSLASPTAGKGVISLGQAIGASAVKVAGNEKSLDDTKAYIDKTINRLGLNQPLQVPTTTGTAFGISFNPQIMMYAGAAILLIVVLFRKK